MAVNRMTKLGAVLVICACFVSEAVARYGDGNVESVDLIRDIQSVRPEALGARCLRERDLPAGGSPLLFIVDKVDAPIFETADATSPRGGDSFRFGKLLFADDVRSDCKRVRVLVIGSDSVVRRGGWMRVEDLLVERRSAVEIEDASRLGLTVERPNLESGINEGNALKLRFVTKPELRVKLGGHPGDDAGDELPAFRWLYVYDIEQHSGEAWGLMGKSARLYPEHGVENTDATGAERLLLGWAPLSKFQIRATNLALELNTNPEAVAHRFARGYGARVLAVRHANARAIYEEPLDYFWPEGNPNHALRGVVDFDPFGIEPSFPRICRPCVSGVSCCCLNRHEGQRSFAVRHPPNQTQDSAGRKRPPKG